jgi:biopolymer transport protein ExbD
MSRLLQNQAKSSRGDRRRIPDQFPVLLTSMVDMFTLILVFLLISYSTGGQLMYMVRDILMPESTSKEQLDLTVEVGVAQDKVYVDGVLVMDSLKDWYAKKELLIPALYEQLKLRAEELKKKAENSPLVNFTGKVTIQADRQIPFYVIKKILFTVDRADFPNMSLAVFQKSK